VSGVALPPEIVSVISELRAVAQRHQVRSIALIGSAARGTFDPSRSDIDLLVDFGDDTSGLGRRALSFYREVQHLFNRKVDVVSLHGVRNPTWRQIHAESKVPIYAAA